MNCKCTLAQRTTGDGCEVCNPTKALEIAHDRIAELEAEVERLQKDSKFLEWLMRHCKIVFWPIARESEEAMTSYPIEHNPHSNKNGISIIRDWHEKYLEGE